MYEIHTLPVVFLTTVCSPCFSQTSFSPEKETMKLFNAYKPVIEKNGDIVVSNTHIITGDINGDGKEDCIVSFERYAKGAVNPVSRE